MIQHIFLRSSLLHFPLAQSNEFGTCVLQLICTYDANVNTIHHYTLIKSYFHFKIEVQRQYCVIINLLARLALERVQYLLQDHLIFDEVIKLKWYVV